MKRFLPLLILLILLVFLAIGLTRDPSKLPSALINKPLPTFSLPSLTDADMTIRSDTLAGAPWVLNVWASWCTACVAEHSVLLDWQRTDPNLRLIGLNYKDDPIDAQKWLTRLGGSPYQQVVVDRAGKFGIDLGMYGVPETFIVSADNVILYRFAGALTSDDIKNTLIPLLAKEKQRLSQDSNLRFHALSKELRCLVCQNESLAESPAGLADDLRIEVREQIESGKTDEQIKHYLVDRYGYFVLYKPPFIGRTLLLWFAPFLILFGLGAWLVWQLVRRPKTSAVLSEVDYTVELEKIKQEFEQEK